MNLITFDEIIRLLRAMDLGLMTEDAVANQILKYREMENTINSSISVTSSNETFQDLRRKVVQRNSDFKRVREGLINDDGTVEWTRVYS